MQRSRIHFTFAKVMNKLISTRNRISIFLVGQSDSGKTYLILGWLKVGIFLPTFNKNYFFYEHLQPLYDIMQKENDHLEFIHGVYFEFINSLKNNGTKYVLVFDHSYAGSCNSKKFVDIAIAG